MSNNQQQNITVPTDEYIKLIAQPKQDNVGINEWGVIVTLILSSLGVIIVFVWNSRGKLDSIINQTKNNATNIDSIHECLIKAEQGLSSRLSKQEEIIDKLEMDVRDLKGEMNNLKTLVDDITGWLGRRWLIFNPFRKSKKRGDEND